MLGIIDQKQLLMAKPVNSSGIDHIIYNKDGTMKVQFIKFCEELGILPSEIHYKKFEDFKTPNISQAIQTIRYNHYESKRLAKIEALKNLIKERHPHIYNQIKAGKLGTISSFRKLSMNYDLGSKSEEEISKLLQANNTAMLVQNIDTNQLLSMSKQSKHNSHLETPVKKNNEQRVWTSVNTKNQNIDSSEQPSKDSYDGDYYDVLGLLEDDYKKYLLHRAIDKDRINKASPKVRQFEESYVEKNKEWILSKEQKFNDSIEKLKKIHQKKIKEKRKKEQEKTEMIMELKHEEEKYRKEKLKKLLAKLDLSETLKEAEIKAKQRKIIQENEGKKIKLQDISLLKDRRESWDSALHLKNLEEKLQKKKEFSLYQIQQRVGALKKHSMQIYETNKKHEDLYLQHHNQLLNRVVDDYFIHSIPKAKKKLDNHKSIEYKHDHVLHKKHELDQTYQNELRKTLTEKSKKIEELTKQRAKNINEFLEMKRELKNLKIDDVRENLSMMVTTKEKADWEKYENYKKKCKEINEWKQNRRKSLALTLKDYSFDESSTGFNQVF